MRHELTARIVPRLRQSHVGETSMCLFRIDAEARTIIPGLNDAYAHFIRLFAGGARTPGCGLL
jgi:hypothetical protein